MIDLTPLDVRKKKGDFRRTVRGYDTELVDDFLDMVAERLEELVKQNVALTERAEHLQEQIASFREREKALNEALVTAQQLRAEAQAQAEREAELVRREARGQAERILEEGRQSLRQLARDIETLTTRKRQFVRTFRSVLERYLAELEVEEQRLSDEAARLSAESMAERLGEPERNARADEEPDESADEQVTEAEAAVQEQRDWLSSILGEREEEDDS